MKLLTLVSSLATAAYAAELGQLDIQDTSDYLETYAETPSSLLNAPNGVKVLPRLYSQPVAAGLKRKAVNYGSFTIQSSKMTKSTKVAAGPCTGTCLVAAMEATIKYGAVFNTSKDANVDTGAWLHHIALFGSGGGQGSLWAAGNERPTLRLANAHKYGLEMSSFMMIIDLMSEDTKAKNVNLFISYDYTEKGTPGWKSAVMYWLTIGEPAAKAGVYKFTSMASSVGYAGKLLYAIGHMHDGGTDMRLYVSGKMVCKSVMHYNAREGYGAQAAAAAGAKGLTGAAKGVAGAAKGKTPSAGRSRMRRDGGPHGGHDGAQHISDPGACTDFGTVSMGDRLTAEAWYDANQHPLMVHNGKKEALMGNMRVYVGPN
jgi:hypothetical protein